MATILLIEDHPDLATYESGIWRDHGHVVVRCGGGPSPLGACTLLRDEDCPIPAKADLIVASVALQIPVHLKRYRGLDLIRGYRRHPRYGSLPMLIVTIGDPGELEGTGEVATLPTFCDPATVVAEAERLLASSGSAQA